MLSRSRYIFLLAVVLLSAFKAFAQLPMPDHVCIGASKRYWADSTANPGSTYIWSVNGTVVQNNTICLFARTWADPGTFELTLQLVSADGCEGEVQSGQVFVDPLLPASVSIAADQNNVCAGTLVTFTATPVNGGIPAYQWFVNGLAAGTGGDNYAYTPANGDIISVTMVSDVGCVSGSPAASNEITITVNEVLAAGVSIVADQTTVCDGTMVTFTATPVNGGPAPAYQWYVNSTAAGTGSDTFVYTPANGEIVTVVMTSVVTCVSGNPATSNEIDLTVDPMLTVDVSVAADANPVYAGTPVTYTATPVNGGPAPVYAWYVNGILVPGETASTYSYLPSDNDNVHATVLSNETCTTGIPATSNIIVMIVYPLIPVSVTLETPFTTVCAGTWVIFTATPFNGGPNPVYSWYVNGLAVPGETTSTYTYIPSDADQVYVMMLSDLANVTNNPATSNTLLMSVTPLTTPVFDPVSPLCQYSIPPELLSVSLNGVNGSWNPALINSSVAGTLTYTFTPDAGVCATTTTLDITIEPQIIPEFDPIGPLCINSTAPELSSVSLNGINGIWNPPTINTAVAGTSTYTFKPLTGLCAAIFSFDITITEQLLPEFAPIGPLCINSTAPALPGTSVNGIPGTWVPDAISTAFAGITTYMFTPAEGQCALTASLEIEITTEILPLFAAVGPLCINSAPPALPQVSTNGLTGTWLPDVISTASAGTTTYIFTPDTGQCAIPAILNITIATEIMPVFTAIGPLCLNSVAPALPAASANGITGIWEPAVISTAAIGTFMYTFTPDAGQCAMAVSLAIQITYPILPSFDPIGPLCQNSTPPFLPNTSLNGITGNWSPDVINTSVTGTSTYLFTPDEGQCAGAATLNITISDAITPEFAAIGPLCQDAMPPALPPTSENGISGTWYPPTINTALPGTSVYTFTPDEGQCAPAVSLEIEISNSIVPIFAAIGPLCQNVTPPVLPATSVNGISGTWNPQAINTSLLGTSVYTFTPDEGECALAVTMEIEISNSIVPVFATLPPLCQFATPPALPVTSENGITGTWNPSTINTALLGTSVYTFTPGNGQCALPVTIEIVISNSIVPVFPAIGPLCLNETPPALPSTSGNGINGSWNPQAISTSVTGTTSFIFTPDAGQCAATATLEIVILNKLNPLFATIGPLCPNSSAPALPSASVNGITGTWVPAAISTASPGITDYIFTPDAGQCAVSGMLSIEVGGPLIIEIQAFTSTNGLANGHAKIIAGGTALPFTYSHNGSDWQAQDEFTGLIAGTYTAWVMDANGCQATQQFVIPNTVTGEVGVLAGNVENCISIPFEIPVMAYDFTNISSFTIQLTFDSTVLHFNSLTQVNKHLNDGSLEASLISPGILQITFTAADSVTLLSEDLLFNLNFNGLSTGNSVLQWDWLQCVIYSAYGYEIPAIYTKGAVDIRPAPQVFTEGAGAYCEDTPLQLQAGSLTGSSLNYTWTSPGGITHNGSKWNFGPLEMADNGEFRLVASDSTKCSKTETIQVQVNPNPVIQFSEYDTLCLEQVVVLNPGSAFVSYAWQDGSIAPLMESIYEGLYWVMVTDTNGCRSSDSVMLVPCDILRIDELEIWLPNAFSPNGDGINDVFGAKYDSEVKITFQMLVFNKWGQQIFSSGDVSKGWDGKFKGERCPPDLYTWVVTFGAPEPYHFSQKSPIRGHVMLLK